MKLRLLIAFSILSSVTVFLAEDASKPNYEVKRIPLVGANGPVGLDYLAYNPATAKIYVPASNTGSVDVIDEKTDAVSTVTGFKTMETERRGKKETIGPTSATIGKDVVYVGNRGDMTVCVVDAKTNQLGECVPLSTDQSIKPDGVLYVAATKEVWVTTRPMSAANIDAAKSLKVFDASDPRHLKFKTSIPLDNLGEGYAVDNGRGLFYTNIEQDGKTVAVDLKTKKIVATWNPGTTNPGGLTLDVRRQFLLVSCRDRVVNLAADHDGKFLDSIQTGEGLDNIDYSAETKTMYAAAGQSANLTIAEVSDDGKFHLKATVPTVQGARNVIAASGETAYVIDPLGGTILKVMRK